MILPSPPTGGEKWLYAEQNKKIYYVIGLVSFVLLVAGMSFFSFRFHFYYCYVFFLVLYLAISYVIGVCGDEFDFTEHVQITGSFSKGEEAVDVFLPSCGEPIEVLENTYKYVASLSWKNLCVYVLDDSGRDEVGQLAANFGFTYLARSDHSFKKAGNLRYGFARSSSPYILILDADFVPAHDMLSELIPYMRADKLVAIVQSPQFFDVVGTEIQKGAAYIQELFYRLIQVSRNTWGASICVGTCALYRRSALEPHGGTALIGHSEDLHTGFMMLQSGWKVKYVPVILSKGLCPDTLQSFFTQQYRWCTGSTTLLSSKNFWVTKLPFMTRLCYLSGMFYYVATALGVLLTPLPALLVVWTCPEEVHWYNIAFAMPSFFYGTFVKAMWSKLPWGWYSLSTQMVSYWAHLFALSDKVRGSTMGWVPTGAGLGSNNRYQIFKFCFCAWNHFIYFAIFLGSARSFTFDFIPMLVFATFHYSVFLHTAQDLGRK